MHVGTMNTTVKKIENVTVLEGEGYSGRYAVLDNGTRLRIPAFSDVKIGDELVVRIEVKD